MNDPPRHYTNLSHSGAVAALTSYPLGTRLLAVAGGDDGRVEMWSLPENLTEASVDVPGGRIAGLAVADVDGRPELVVAGADGAIMTWDWRWREFRVLGRHGGSAYTVAVTHIGGCPVALSGGGDGMVRLWDLRTEAPRAEPVELGPGRVLAVAADDGPSFVAGGESGLAVADLSRPGHVVVRRLAGDGVVSSVATASLAGERILVSVTDRETVSVRRLADGAVLYERVIRGALCLAPVQVQKRAMVAVGDTAGVVRLIGLENGLLAAEFTGHDAPVSALAAGDVSGHAVLLSGDDSGRVVAWALDPGAELAGPFARGLALDLPDPWPVRRDRPPGLAPLSDLGVPQAPPPLRELETEGVARAAAPPRAEVPSARRLTAQIWTGGKRERRVLAPGCEHQVIVGIAVPKRGDLFNPELFPEQQIPAGEGLETLTVDFTDEDTGLSQTKEIALPTLDRTQPSTPAVFTLTTGAEGSLVRLAVIVLFHGRPIQKVRIFAVARSAPVPGDAVRIIPVPLSSNPEPRAETTAADITLDMQGDTVRRVGQPGSRVDLSNLGEILEQIEQLASGCFTSADAPPTPRTETGRQLLVGLARLGCELGELLSPLHLGDTGTIAVLVQKGSPVLPLELVYSGPVPNKHAKVCTHPPDAQGTCAHASTARVCPWAFWGVQRVIARTFAGDVGDKPRQPVPQPLGLRPVLYAAAERADKDPGQGQIPSSAGTERPSDWLQHTLAEMMGAAQVTRVTSWTGWRKAIRGHPELLVVLGHTQLVNGETTVEIGEHSILARPDLNASFLGNGPPPLVLLIACATAASFDPFGGFPAAFTERGAAAVVATLSKLRGPDGANAAAALVRSLRTSAGASGSTLGAALTAARRELVADGWLIGLLLVAHGEIDTMLRE